MTETIYYSLKKNYWWLGFNIVFLALFIMCLICCPAMWYWWQLRVLLAVFAVSLLVWVYKYGFKHRMALITDEDITIDHTNPIKWEDIKLAEERIVNCCGSKRKVIVLIPREDLEYKYNFLQRHNGEFTPFSIPLYGLLSAEDEEKVAKIVAKKVGLKIL